MDALPPDPYAALGVAKDATTAAIKQQYRKLVLRLHPDKVQDDALKQAAADQFHKVQTAYEVVGDDDRRQRYDAQCKLEQLRRDAMERGGGGRGGPDVRTAGFKMPPDSPRGGDFYARGPERSGRMSPQYEERAPRYTDYFDIPRPMSRKDSDFERSSKRAPPRDDPKKSRSSAKKSKENERSSRDEKTRRTEQDVRKGREQKFAFVSEQSPTSDSDEYDRARKQGREEDEARRVRAAMEDEARRKQEEEAAASFIGNERAQKLYAQDFSAREYMAKGGISPQERLTTERRPSPVRKSSSREKVEYIKRNDGRPPVMIRRGSGRPETTREPRKSSSREKDIEIVDEPQEKPRRPPTLEKMQSSPADIRPPFGRQRSSSLQYDPREPPIPKMKRAETMPYPQTNGASGESRRKDPSKLRTEIRDGYPTPETSPEPPPTTRKYIYGQVYADDTEYPTPDGYRTEVREPASPRTTTFTRSPSPIREPREKQRSKSVKYASPQPPPNKRTTSTTYVYPAPAEVLDSNTRRPSLQRESSSRLFGEIPTTGSPRPSQGKYSPPADDISYSPKLRPEDIKTATRPEQIRTATGYKVRRPSEKTHSNRQATPLSAR